MSIDNNTSGNINVTMATLKSHNHIVGDIERGVKLYERGGIEFGKDPNLGYIADILEKGEHRRVLINFAQDGCDLKSFFCNKCAIHNEGALCRHVVAAVLAIQGKIAQTKLELGKVATVSVTVDESNTAKAVGSGSLDVFATPMMIALMEQAACEALSNTLQEGQTSVGTMINIEHIAASPIGAKITATATIELVLGRRIEFAVTASDETAEIGRGKHTRIIVDGSRFMKKAQAQK